MAERAPYPYASPATPASGQPRTRARRGRAGITVPEGFRNPLAPTPQEAPPVLLPLLGLDDDITPAIEALLAPVAIRAQEGDWAARNALYAAFEPKLNRFVRRVRVPYAPGDARGIWDREDVAQEGFLVFAALVDAWPADIPFGRYVLANFPWRLRDAIHRGFARPLMPQWVRVVPVDAELVASDPGAPRQESAARVEAIAAALQPPLDDFMRLHILERLTLDESASEMSVSSRTGSRYWQAIREWMCREWV
jgi:DNA-directed RNA polymerase specialized sigma24 family protein